MAGSFCASSGRFGLPCLSSRPGAPTTTSCDTDKQIRSNWL
jgi:hypothetical protein